MKGQVIVCNVRKPIPEGFTAIYVGRGSSYKPAFGENFSVLGNPYTMPRYTREEAIAEYRKWFNLKVVVSLSSPQQGAVDALICRVQSGENLALCCFCAPQACHAAVIKEILEGEE